MNTVAIPPTKPTVASVSSTSAMPSGNSSDHASKSTVSKEVEKKVLGDKNSTAVPPNKYPAIVGIALKNPSQLDGMDVNKLRHELGRLNKLQKRLNHQVVSKSKSSNRDAINAYLGNVKKASEAISAALLKKNP